ncbi:XRE family transcriptional regulator [Bordetella avium]|nr:XRE family transcriptional regulator [Bordetella avium]
MDSFGRRLRQARKDANLTQAAAAKRAGMSQSTLSDLESDGSASSTYTPRLAYIYGVNARWLADGDGPMHATDQPPGSSTTHEQWPFSPRIPPDAYAVLDRRAKEEVEDFIEMKISKTTRRKNAALT